SRPATSAEDTNWARPRAKRGDRPPPSAASRLLPTLSTARRQAGSATVSLSPSPAVVIGSARIPFVDRQGGTARGGQRIGGDQGAGLVQPGQALEHIGATSAIAEATGQLQHATRAQRVQPGQVRGDRGRIELRPA